MTAVTKMLHTQLEQGQKQMSKRSKSLHVSLASFSLIGAFLITLVALSWKNQQMEKIPIVQQMFLRPRTRVLQEDVPLVPMNRSEIVNIKVQEFLPTSCDETFLPTIVEGGKPLHVKVAMEADRSSQNLVLFFMLNGENEGIYVSWNGVFSCVEKAAQLAAKYLGADMNWAENGIRMYSQKGYPVRNLEELKASQNIVHILFDFQIWMWPGIEIGHKYELEDGVTLKTVGLSPKVFDVEQFFTAEDVIKIKHFGIPELNRSQVNIAGNSVSTGRTSYTAFLADSVFTRDIQVRAAKVAHLPSPSFVENLQLVRYEEGQLYRRHVDAFKVTKYFPNVSAEYNYLDYSSWADWASTAIKQLPNMDTIPEAFRPGGPLFPNSQDTMTFQHSLLQLFYDDANAKNFFLSRDDTSWSSWIFKNLEKKANNILNTLLKSQNRPAYLPYMIKAWENAIGLGELRYTFPTKRVNGVTHYLRWIRWAKERISFYGDQIPEIARPYGEWYPKFDTDFEKKMLHLLVDEFPDQIKQYTNEDWLNWITSQKNHKHTLLTTMLRNSRTFDLVFKAWEKKVQSELLVYTKPAYVKHIIPQRFVTLFLYLEDVPEGGETVFPYSLDKNGSDIERKGMSECAQGLVVPPRRLHASLFYVLKPDMEPDLLANHGGCPPVEGIKWGSNSFMWNGDAIESSSCIRS